MKTIKSEKTSGYIIATVAPIFNKNGYAATSMSDLTNATGLTKGAIYGNFKNKEDLAYEAFRYNVKNVLRLIGAYINITDSPTEKLFLLLEFYKKYYELSQGFGGCPILNIGVDANNQNEKLLWKVRSTILKMEESLHQMIEEGIQKGELKAGLDPKRCAKLIFATIEGAVFMASTMNEAAYITEIMEITENMIRTQWKK